MNDSQNEILSPTEAQPAFEPARLQQCIETLEAIVADRRLMAHLDQEKRKRMVMAAGRLAKPDRHAITKLSKALRVKKKKVLFDADRNLRETTEIRSVRQQEKFIAPEKTTSTAPAARILHKAQYCYVCKAEFRELHFFYDSMCPKCAEFNYSKRFQIADLRGRIALITGSRVKIGYQAALRMLQCGASVIVTTRFPNDAAIRFRAEKDFSDWQDRLHIFGLDLRHAPSVEAFAKYISENFSHLDFLLNNAAQTVRRPRGFYKHLLAAEEGLPQDAGAQRLLSMFMDCRSKLDRNLLAPAERGLISYVAELGGPAAPGLYASAAMSQVPLLPDDLSCGAEVFPEEKYDADLQQVDLRQTNSWRMTLADVPTAELLEIQLINAVAPFILCSKLKPLMLRVSTADKHVVNVSAMEGKFSRFTKTDKHPHTNMAKAALNMMTQTSAPDYVKDGIHMNAVDTGWVTDEDPAQHAQRKKQELGFQPPLDIVDGAARICDPIFHGLNTGQHMWGLFLKDYIATNW